MALDPNIFFQGAALRNARQQQDLAALGQLGNTFERIGDKKEKGLDLEKLAQRAVYKTELGGQATPEEEAAFKAYQRFESAKQGVDPNTGELYPKFRSFDLSGQPSGPKGFDISILPPASRAPQAAPMGVPAMSDADFLNTPVAPLETSGAPLNMGMLEGDALPQVPRETGGFDLGNIDLSNRPVVKNADGTISTVRSMSFNDGDKEILIPTVSDDGKILSEDEAIKNYYKTGKNLGKFNSPEEATKYAEDLHNQQAEQYGGFDLGALQQPVSDALPQVGLPAQGLNLPQATNPVEKKANYAAELEIAKEVAKEQAKEGIKTSTEGAKMQVGRQKFDNTVQMLVDRLGELQQMGGMASAGQGGVQSAKNYLSATGIGQEVGRAAASQDQAIRDEISSLRMGLKAALKEATGMSAQEMNSNTELQTFLDSITNPRSTYEANYNMAANLSKLYGTGAISRMEAKPKTPNAPIQEGKLVRQKSTGKVGRIINGEFVPQ